MKTLAILLALLCLPWTAKAQSSENCDGLFFRIGLSSRIYSEVNRNDAAAAYKAWAGAIFKEHELEGQPQVKLFDRFEDLRKEVSNKRLNAVALTVEELIDSAFLFLPACRGRSRENVEKALLEVHTTPGGLQFLTVFQSSRLEKGPFSVLEDTMTFLKGVLDFSDHALFEERPS